MATASASTSTSPTNIKITRVGTELTITVDPTGTTLKDAMDAVSNRTYITKITITNPGNGAKIIPENDLSYFLFRLSSLDSIIGLEYIDMTNVTSMHRMFSNCESLTSLDLSGWNTEKVTDMNYVFYRCYTLSSINLSNWNTEKVTNMYQMFYGCSSLTSLDLSGWDTKNVTTMGNIFADCSSLTSLDLSGWNTENITNYYSYSDMFYGCDSIIQITVSSNLTSNISNQISLPIVAGKNCYWKRDSDNRLFGTTNIPTINGKTEAGTYRPEYIGNMSKVGVSQVGSELFVALDPNGTTLKAAIRAVDDIESITKISIADPGNGVKIIPENDLNELFQNFKSLNSIEGLEHVNTLGVTTMNSMFAFCLSLTYIDVSYFNLRNTRDISYMFYSCRSIRSIVMSGWNTENAKSMSAMFTNCVSLTNLDLSDWNTEKVTSMNSIFTNCSSLTVLDVSSWNTANVINMEFMFSGCSSLTALDVLGWNTANVTKMLGMFSGCSSLTALDLSGWNTAKVTSMNSYYLSAPIGMFSGCSSLTALDLSGWNTKNARSMNYMFSGCSSLTALDLSGWNTKNVRYMNYMFSDCSSLDSLNLSPFNTLCVTNMCGILSGCSSLEYLDISSWNTVNVTDMDYIFDCPSLKHVIVSSMLKSGISDQIDPTHKQPYGNSSKWQRDYDGYISSRIPTTDGKAAAGSYRVAQVEFLLSFDANGGNGSFNDITVSYEESLGSLPIPTRTDYEFDGWTVDGVAIDETTVWTYLSNKTAVAHYKVSTSQRGTP